MSVTATPGCLGAAVAACGDCAHLRAAPQWIEAALPGLTSMGSAYSSVRAGDGLCAVHDRYVALQHRCGAYVARSGALTGTDLHQSVSSRRLT